MNPRAEPIPVDLSEGDSNLSTGRRDWYQSRAAATREILDRDARCFLHQSLSMWDSFHGASLDAIGVGGEALFRRGMGPLLPGAIHVPPPVPHRCLCNPSGECARCDLRCARYIA